MNIAYMDLYGVYILDNENNKTRGTTLEHFGQTLFFIFR